MIARHKQRKQTKGPLLRRILPVLVTIMLGVSGTAVAAGSLVVTPTKGLADGQTVSVSGTGLAAGSTGAILECNSDAGQPTVTVAGNAVPVSCTNPLSKLVTTDKGGSLIVTSFTVHTGTVGPPGAGTDSTGGNAATDAAKYPCPPTAAQIAAGDTCVVTFGDANNDDVSQAITFASQTAAATTPAPAAPSAQNSATSTPAATSTAQPSSSAAATVALTNTGPGDTILLFIGTVVIGALLRYYYLLRGQNLGPINR